MLEIAVRLEVKCADCDHRLECDMETEWSNKDGAYIKVACVTPCSECVREARENGYAEGHEVGAAGGRE